MSEESISNIYIDQLMKKISWSFRGTFSCNNIPIFNDENFSLIVNLSREGEIGTHFIAIIISSNQILYFDSFGIQNTNDDIKKYLKKYKRKISYSKNQIQHLSSSHCAFFCISFVLSIENWISPKLYFKLFDKKCCV